MYVIYGLRALTLCTCISVVFSESSGRVCYHAKICVHNGIEKCGINSNGTARRFLDSCDIKEYNCLKGTDFVKTNDERCKSLPLLKTEKKSKKHNLNNEISKSEEESMTLKSSTGVSKSMHRGIKISIKTNAHKTEPNENEDNGTIEEDNVEEEQEEVVEEEENLNDKEVKSNEASKANDDVDEDNNNDNDSVREEDNVSEASGTPEVKAKDSNNEEQSPNGD